jgi:uncharacterized protein (TIGR02147 family)
MSWRTSFYDLLRAEFAEIKARNKGKFSLRAYAHKLRIPPSTLSQMITGNQKWTLSVSTAIDILERMSVPNAKKAKLRALMGAPTRMEFRKIQNQDLELFTEPVHFAILSGFTLPGPQRSTEALAARFGITVEEVDHVVELLLKKGYLRRGENGVVEVNSDFWEMADGPSNETVRRFHTKNLKLAAKALNKVPAEERHFSSFTFAGGKSQLTQLNNEIRGFHERIQALLNQEDANDEIFTVTIGLFPVRGFTAEGAE